MIDAVIWDFGGVISSSPFEAFARFEAARGLPRDFLRTVNATDPHENAWARLERSELDVPGFGARLKTGCITNNFTAMSASPMGSLYKAEIMRLFHHVIESAKAGVRKPDPRIYRMMTDTLGVAPERCVYLDDLGINLKPAREMGMRTIKVGEPGPALVELERFVGFPLG